VNLSNLILQVKAGVADPDMDEGEDPQVRTVSAMGL
jgi:hypothetical protein